jgi:hypothetical protein
MKRLVIFILLLSTPALAESTPEAQAFALRLVQEINSTVQCTAGSIILNQELDKIKLEVKRLKDKYEPGEGK